VAELREVLKAYGDERRTQIVDRVEEIKLEDLIKDERWRSTVSHAGYVKRTPSTSTAINPRRQRPHRCPNSRRRFRRALLCCLRAQLHSALHVEGRVYWLKVYEIPEAAAATRGKAINSIVRFQENEKLTPSFPRAISKKQAATFFSQQRTARSRKRARGIFEPRPAGIIAINLDEHDEIDRRQTHRRQAHGLPGKHDGQAILFRETEVRPMGRQAGGVNGMDLARTISSQHGCRKGRFRDRQKGIQERNAESSTSSKSDEIRESLTYRSC